MTDEDPMNVYSEESVTATIESEIEATEMSRTRTESEGTGWEPAIQVTSKFPTGTDYTQFPLFSQIEEGHLEVLFVANEKFRHPTVCGVYNWRDGGYFVIEKSVAESVPTIEDYDSRTSPDVGDAHTVLWDALWDDTTDPVCDIQLSDKDWGDSENGIRTRPWE